MTHKQLIDSAYIRASQLHQKLQVLEGSLLDLQMEVRRASQDADGLCSWLEEQRFKEPVNEDQLDPIARILYHPEEFFMPAGKQ